MLQRADPIETGLEHVLFGLRIALKFRNVHVSVYMWSVS